MIEPVIEVPPPAPEEKTLDAAPIKFPEPIANDLTHKIETLRVLSKLNDVLRQGSFNFMLAPAVAEGLDFITGFHKKVAAETLAHPQAHLVPDLEALRKSMKGQDNGKA